MHVCKGLSMRSRANGPSTLVFLVQNHRNFSTAVRVQVIRTGASDTNVGPPKYSGPFVLRTVW